MKAESIMYFFVFGGTIMLFGFTVMALNNSIGIQVQYFGEVGLGLVLFGTGLIIAGVVAMTRIKEDEVAK